MDNALRAAQGIAEAADAGYIGTEHLLAALTEPSVGRTAQVLKSVGVDAARVEQTADLLLDEAGRHPRPGGGGGQLPPLPAVRTLIEAAFDLSGGPPDRVPEEGEPHVRPDHLLLCLFRAHEEDGSLCLGARVLTRLGVTEERFAPILG